LGQRTPSEVKGFGEESPYKSEEMIRHGKTAPAVQQVERAKQLPPRVPKDIDVDRARQEPVRPEFGQARTALEERVDQIGTVHPGDGEEPLRRAGCAIAEEDGAPL
jgi:hypothetical protein